ncbi:MAG: glycosyltransferase [Gemmatimonadaceae bacterium]
MRTSAGQGRIARVGDIVTSNVVSMLVTAHNAGHTIEQTVGALVRQSLPLGWTAEVVVVNDRSSDETGAVLDRLARLDAQIRVISCTTMPDRCTARQAALDAAVAAATGEVLLVVDADAIPPTRWAAQMLKALETFDLVASCLEFTPAGRGTGARALGALQTVDSAHYLAVCGVLAALGMPSGVCFGGAGFRRTLVHAIGPFVSYGGTLVEDLTFARAARRVGRRVGVLWGTPVQVTGVTDFDALLQRATRTSASAGPSLLGLALGLWGATLLAACVAAALGAIPVVLAVARWAIGALWAAAHTVRAGAWRVAAWSVVYEPVAIVVALLVAIRYRRQAFIRWGGLSYRQVNGRWVPILPEGGR